jgi:hypothetical protein
MHIRRDRKSAIALAVAVLVLLGTWWAVNHFRDDPRVARLEHLTRQLTGPEQTARESQRARWKQWRRELDALTPVQRQQFWGDRRATFRDWLSSLMSASKNDRAEMLSQVISAIKEFRRQWQEEGNAAGPGWRADLSPLELEQRQQEWLAMTTPQERALVEAFLRMLAAQSQLLGETTSSPWGDDSPT